MLIRISDRYRNNLIKIKLNSYVPQMVKTTSNVFTKTRPNKEEKLLFPCKKDFAPIPEKKTKTI